MKNNTMNADVRTAKIHRAAYRPSSNLSRFFKSLMSVIVAGHSPIEHRPAYIRRVK